MKVIAGSDQPLHETDCTFCGSCIDVCPVNAILEADRWRKGRNGTMKSRRLSASSVGTPVT